MATIIRPELRIKSVIELSNDLRLRILQNKKNQENVKTSWNNCLMVCPPKIKILSVLARLF